MGKYMMGSKASRKWSYFRGARGATTETGCNVRLGSHTGSEQAEPLGTSLGVFFTPSNTRKYCDI